MSCNVCGSEYVEHLCAACVDAFVVDDDDSFEDCGETSLGRSERRLVLPEPEYWCVVCGWSDEPCEEFHTGLDIYLAEKSLIEGESKAEESCYDTGGRQ